MLVRFKRTAVVVGSVSVLAALCAGCTRDSGAPRDERSVMEQMHEQMKEPPLPPGDEAGIAGDTEAVDREKTEGTREVYESVVKEDLSGGDINRMSAQEFMSYGLSRGEAEAIVRKRASAGPFKSLNDLKSAGGVSSAWLKAAKGRLTVGSG